MKRNKKVKKAIKQMQQFMIGVMGEEEYGTFLAIFADSVSKLLEDREEIDARTVEIKYNDYFSTKFNFKTRKYE